MELRRESNQKSVPIGSRLKWTPVVAVIVGGLWVHALWNTGRILNQAACGGNRGEALGEQEEHVVQFVRSIRVDSDSPPWIMMHALLAFGPDFEILDVKRDKPVRILHWICGAGSAGFFRVVPGNPGESHSLPTGVQSRSECHPDQWLGILSARSVPLTQRIALGGKHFTLSDLLETSKRRSGSTCSETAAWTIPALCRYLPGKARWQNELEEEVTMTSAATDFLQNEDWRTGPCQGTHHLHALASLKAAGILKGDAAARLDRVLKEALHLLQRNQNSDGTWMCHWQTEKDRPQSTFDTIYITGHHLEWIAIAATEAQLREKWLQDAVHGLIAAIERVDKAEVRKRTATCPEIYGSLCHAARGLYLIHTRRCGDPDRGRRR